MITQLFLNLDFSFLAFEWPLCEQGLVPARFGQDCRLWDRGGSCPCLRHPVQPTCWAASVVGSGSHASRIYFGVFAGSQPQLRLLLCSCRQSGLTSFPSKACLINIHVYTHRHSHTFRFKKREYILCDSSWPLCMHLSFIFLSENWNLCFRVLSTWWEGEVLSPHC